MENVKHFEITSDGLTMGKLRLGNKIYRYKVSGDWTLTGWLQLYINIQLVPRSKLNQSQLYKRVS